MSGLSFASIPYLHKTKDDKIWKYQWQIKSDKIWYGGFDLFYSQVGYGKDKNFSFDIFFAIS